MRLNGWVYTDRNVCCCYMTETCYFHTLDHMSRNQVLNQNHIQSWKFIGKTDAEAETPILWPPNEKNWLIWKDWCWERLKVGGEGDNRGWDGGMASPTWWTRIWVNSRSWWWTGRLGMLQSMGLQRVGHNWATELN